MTLENLRKKAVFFRVSRQIPGQPICKLGRINVLLLVRRPRLPVRTYVKLNFGAYLKILMSSQVVPLVRVSLHLEGGLVELLEGQTLGATYLKEIWGVISHLKPIIFVFQNVRRIFLQIKEKTGRISQLLSVGWNIVKYIEN